MTAAVVLGPAHDPKRAFREQLSYACGLTAIRTRDYLAGTVLGVLPSAVVFVTIGAYGADPGRWPFVVAVAGLLVLVAGMVVARRRGAGHPA